MTAKNGNNGQPQQTSALPQRLSGWRRLKTGSPLIEWLLLGVALLLLGGCLGGYLYLQQQSVSAREREPLSMDKPLIMAASRDVPGIVAAWRQGSGAWGAVFGLLVLTSAACLGVSQQRRQRQCRRVERLETELARRDSEEKFRVHVEHSIDVLFTLDAQGLFLFASPAWERHFGYPVSEILGQPFAPLVHPEDIQPCFACLTRVMASGEDETSPPYRVRHADGSWRWFVANCTLVCAPDGERHLMGVAHDVTVSKRNDEILKESEERWKFALEGAGDGVFDWNIQTGEAQYSTRWKEMLGFAESEIGNRASEWTDRVHPQDLPAVTAALQSHFAGTTASAVVEFRMLCKDGSWAWTLGRGMVARRDGEGKPLRLVGTHSDISERKRAQAALEKAKSHAENDSLAKSRFLAAASHDLRQPAHALGLFVARLAELKNDPPTQHLVTCMDASVKAMQDMLDGFFDISRLDANSTPIEVVAFPLEPVFEQLRNGFSSAALDKGLRLHFRPSRAWVQSDPSLLHRILLNLLSNAVRYTAKGSVLVACRPARDGKHVRIEVWDSGIGVAAQHHEDIFSEFFQVENPGRDRSKGLGVGLSIVDRACRLLGYSLALRSELGRGTRFTLTVPQAPAQSHNRHDVSTVAPLPGGLAGLKVLIIEDDALGREGLASLLTSWGCTVTAAQGAQMACDLCQHDQTIGLIISDFRLSDGVNGIEAVRRVRDTVGQPVPACLISGDTDVNLSEQAQRAGLVLLQKPVRPAKLRSLLRHLAQAGTRQAQELLSSEWKTPTCRVHQGRSERTEGVVEAPLVA